MKINPSTFTVTILANKYPKEDTSINHEGTVEDKVEKVQFDIELNRTQAANFLFKFTPSVFKYKDYQVFFKYTDTGIFQTIGFNTDECIYLVINPQWLLSEIHEGYFRLITNEKVQSILEFDYNIDYSNDEIKDEFDSTEESY